MQSHWGKQPTLRVVDAGYLLAGMEPERKWQFAPPLVANFFNLIRDKTGAVKLATMPGERMEITQAEFQALKAEYGMTPATEPQATTPSPAPAPFVELVAQRGYVLALPSGQTHVQFGELAHLIADALWPEAGADDTLMSYGLSRASLDGELVQAVKAGTLQVKDPLTFGPHTFPVGNALRSALVTVDDLREFVAGRGLTVETTKPQATIPSPAPVVNVCTSDGVEPDKAGPVPVEQGLLTKDIAVCFGDCYFSADNWPKRLSGTAWLETARIGRGEIGGASAVWNPLTLAQLMHRRTKGDKAKEKLMKTFNSRFTRNPALGLWRDAFNEYFATYCTTD